MKKYFLLLSLIVLHLSCLYSQSEFYPGYIISNNNDTTHGLIENNSFVQNAKYCVFKESENAETIKYSPSDIKAYRFVNGKYYSSEMVNDVPLFLEYLVKGRLNLFFSRDKDGYNYFFVSKNDIPLTELNTSKRILGEDNSFSIDTSMFAFSGVTEKSFQSKKFIGVLKYCTDNNPKLITDINNAELTHQSLIGIVNKYNNLTDEKENTYSKKFKRNIIVQVGSGMSVFNVVSDNAVNFNTLLGVNAQNNADLDIQKIFRPSYGAQVLFQQSERNENLYLGLGFFHYGMLNKYISFFRVPLSINYLTQKSGISPTFSYQLDLNRFALFQMAETGLKYQLKKFLVNLNVGLYSNQFIRIYGYSMSLRVGYQF